MPQMNSIRVQSMQDMGDHSVKQDIIFLYGSTLLGGLPKCTI
jgi:hypothetical protein